MEGIQIIYICQNVKVVMDNKVDFFSSPMMCYLGTVVSFALGDSRF